MDRISDENLDEWYEFLADDTDEYYIKIDCQVLKRIVSELKERRENEKNISQKYELALAEMTKYFRCNKQKGLYVSEKECHKYKSCSQCMVDYFKKQAGFEVPS